MGVYTSSPATSPSTIHSQSNPQIHPLRPVRGACMSSTLQSPAHNTPIPFRKTRHGTAFSPWVSDYGPPLHAPIDFDLHRLVRDAILSDSTQTGGDDASEPVEAVLPAIDHGHSCTDANDPDPSSSNAFLDPSSFNASSPEPSPSNALSPEPPHRPPLLDTSFQLNSMASPFKSAPTAEGTPAPYMSKQRYHAKQRSKRRRLAARMKRTLDAANSSDAVPASHRHRPKLVAARWRTRATPIGANLHANNDAPAPLHTAHLPLAKNAYSARNVLQDSATSRGMLTKEELIGLGFEYVPWDGSTPRLLVDSNNVVLGVLAGRPRGVEWDNLVQEVTEVLHEARRQCDKQRVIDNLLADKRVSRILNFANSAFQVFAPKLHRYYKATLDRICESDPTLKRNSPGNSFAAATFNLGPQTFTRPHLDHLNLPWGWCAITALGAFNHTRCGQVVLWNLKKIIEFPCAATIFILSAVAEHSNLALDSGEERLSITQYTAGALFRWVESGNRLLRDLDKAMRADMETNGRARWETGIAMLSTTLDLLTPFTPSVPQ
ncbi:hypothetical protein ONZ51_g11436 [Trametes cubensis]|uniref:Uncharacterized protein n=1 Tax=Trametes cubensis TaxID=1111947 RepID=A0AAD7TIQ1_9APHY|nr:hypothetical protein ONZ51_g11436 [Trametes cubensis]